MKTEDLSKKSLAELPNSNDDDELGVED